MMGEMPNYNGIDPSMLWITVIVVIAVIGVIVLILDFILKVREVRKPKVASEKSVADRLEDDADRLRILEENDKKRDGEFKLLLKAQMAMMQHLLDGNNVEKLKEARDQINDYLVYGTMKN